MHTFKKTKTKPKNFASFPCWSKTCIKKACIQFKVGIKLSLLSLDINICVCVCVCVCKSIYIHSLKNNLRFKMLSNESTLFLILVQSHPGQIGTHSLFFQNGGIHFYFISTSRQWNPFYHNTRKTSPILATVSIWLAGFNGSEQEWNLATPPDEELTSWRRSRNNGQM